MSGKVIRRFDVLENLTSTFIKFRAVDLFLLGISKVLDAFLSLNTLRINS